MKPPLYMVTYSGNKFYPDNFKPSDVHLTDIAHALCNICRFGGHCDIHYSVAEHSLHVAELVKEHKLTALLHDAAEAYLGDIPTPIKAYLPEYKAMEKKVLDAIYERFDIEPLLGREKRELKFVDTVMVCHEARYLLKRPQWLEHEPYKTAAAAGKKYRLPHRLGQKDSETLYCNFIDAFFKYGGKP